MDSQATVSIQLLQRWAASLLLYQSVLQEEVGQAFLDLLQSLTDRTDSKRCLQAYGRWFNALAAKHQSWSRYLLNQMLLANNPFTQQAQSYPLEHLPPALIAAAQHDLQALQLLYNCDVGQLSQWVYTVSGLPVPAFDWTLEEESLLTSRLHHLENWGDALGDLATYYRSNGIGLFAEYWALRWQAGSLAGIAYPDPVRLVDLTGYEAQKQVLIKNTEFLLAGYPALHVLLYGSRGSGKSSLVKALLHEYGAQGLRLIEVAKADLQDLPAIAEPLRSVPQKFILFVDDLSFEEDESAYKALKVVLEGNLTARPQNIVVYATSNRRHLIREFFADRPSPSQSDEVHNWDTVQEKLSFSDRFGLTLTFEPADQSTYLQIIHHLAQQAGITLSPPDLEYQALQWATRHNGRSGRSARQFVDFLRAEQAFGAGG